MADSAEILYDELAPSVKFSKSLWQLRKKCENLPAEEQGNWLAGYELERHMITAIQGGAVGLALATVTFWEKKIIESHANQEHIAQFLQCFERFQPSEFQHLRLV